MESERAAREGDEVWVCWEHRRLSGIGRKRARMWYEGTVVSVEKSVYSIMFRDGRVAKCELSLKNYDRGHRAFSWLLKWQQGQPITASRRT